MSDAFKTVATFFQLHEAQLGKALLASAGIEARLQDSGIVGAHPLLSNAVGGVKLQVPAEREKEARQLLSAMEGKRAASDSTCISCGAQMAESESRCSACGWSYLDEGEPAPLKH